MIKKSGWMNSIAIWEWMSVFTRFTVQCVCGLYFVINIRLIILTYRKYKKQTRICHHLTNMNRHGVCTSPPSSQFMKLLMKNVLNMKDKIMHFPPIRFYLASVWVRHYIMTVCAFVVATEVCCHSKSDKFTLWEWYNYVNSVLVNSSKMTGCTEPLNFLTKCVLMSLQITPMIAKESQYFALFQFTNYTDHVLLSITNKRKYAV